MLQMPRGRRHTAPQLRRLGCAGAEAGGEGQAACQVEGAAEAAPREHEGAEGDTVQPCVSRVARQCHCLVIGRSAGRQAMGCCHSGCERVVRATLCFAGCHDSLEEPAEIMHVVGFESRLVALCVSGQSRRFRNPLVLLSSGGRRTTFRGSSTEPTLARNFGDGVGAPAQNLHKQHRFSPVMQDEVKIHIRTRAHG